MQASRFGPASETQLSTLKKELLIFAVLLLFGLIVLPVCVYVVGQNLIGQYSPDAGVSGLLTAIWNDLAGFAPAAWILVLSPWLVIQLLRLGVRLWRRPVRHTRAADAR